MKTMMHRIFLLFTSTLTPMLVFAQETASDAQERSPQGQHFGLSDEVWLGIFMGTAVVFTIIIITINSAIKNLAETKSLWKPKETATILMLFISGSAIARETGAEASVFILSDSAFWALATANLFLMFFTLMQLRLLRNVTRKISGLDDVAVEEAPFIETETIFARLWKRINDHKEVENEKDILLNHDYDGIMELDNNLPPWWKWTFYLSIVFAVVYLTHYHITKTGDLPHAELQASVEKGKEEVAAYLARASMNVDESSVKYVLEDDRLKAGSSIFNAHCAVCHGAEGQGLVGPNLTDPYWLHGGSINDVFKVVKYGVQGKGMKEWRSELSPVQIQNVSTYILALQGTQPPDQKDAEGEYYEPAIPEGAKPDEEDGVEQDSPSEGDNEESTKDIKAQAL